MKFLSAVGTALLGLALQNAAAQSTELNTKSSGDALPKILTIYGKSLPPVGYVGFCAHNEDECKFKGGKAERLPMSPEKWNMISQVNLYVNSKIKPISDMDQYHVADNWTYPVSSGDCEDYVLLKKRYLVGMGFSPDELLITVVFDENGDGHAVMSIPTDGGDYVLDNRRDEILLWNQTGYKFLKRQSQSDPRLWVSLQKSAPQVLVSTKSN
jgi:predicted transglutaminase-like cysteine proteinase